MWEEEEEEEEEEEGRRVSKERREGEGGRWRCVFFAFCGLSFVCRNNNCRKAFILFFTHKL